MAYVPNAVDTIQRKMGIVWNTAMMLWIGFENEERYRWTLALAITMFSAAVNLFAERAEEAEEDGGDEDEES